MILVYSPKTMTKVQTPAKTTLLKRPEVLVKIDNIVRMNTLQSVDPKTRALN